jgi:hypothetical protein
MSRSESRKMHPVELPLLLKQQPHLLFHLTGRQILLLLCGCVVSVSLWQTFGPSAFAVCLSAVPALVAVLLAFVRLNARPLEEWVLVFVAWLLFPEHLTREQLWRLFIKIRAIGDDMVGIDLGHSLEYYAVVRVTGNQFNPMDEAEQIIQLEAFHHLLDGLSYPLTIHIRMDRYSPVSPSDGSVPSNLSPPLRRLYAHYLSFLSRLVRQKHPTSVATYLLIAAECKKTDDSREQARIQLLHRIHELERQLARANLTLYRLRSLELLAFYQQSFLAEAREVGPCALMDAAFLQDALVPHRATVAASWVKMQAERHHYVACLALACLPRVVSPGWLGQVLEADDLQLDISLHLLPFPAESAVRHLQYKAAQLGGVLLAAEKQGHHGDVLTRLALKDVERVRDRLLRREEHLFSLTLLLLVRAASRRELHERVGRVQLLLRSLDFQAYALRFQHQLGYLSCLYGQSLLRRYSHLLPTEAVASFSPFASAPRMDGILLGTTSSGQLIALNPGNQLNANLAVLGVPGSGKSFCFKVLLGRLAPSVNISIIDLEGEYTRWVQAVGSQRVCFTPETFHINPLELAHSTPPTRHTLHERVTAVAGFCALLIGEGGKVSPSEKALIWQCLLDTYAEHGITGSAMTHAAAMPTMTDFFMMLKRKDESFDLWRRLAPYIHLFPQKTTVPFTYPHIVYDLQQLPEVLRPAASYLIADRVWINLQEQRQEAERQAGKRVQHLVVVDEAWFLCKFEQGADLLGELARRIRKYGGGLWLGTQQIGDLLSREQGRNVLSLCETKLLFRQDASSIDAVRATLHLSEKEARFLQTARCGEALHLVGKNALAVEIPASPVETAMAQSVAIERQEAPEGRR